MTTKTTTDAVFDAINDELCDDVLSQMFDALRARQKQVRANEDRKQAAAIKRGDLVRVVKASPKYLIGATATVERVDGTKVHVVMDADDFSLKRFRGAPVTCGAGMLEVVDADERKQIEASKLTQVPIVETNPYDD